MKCLCGCSQAYCNIVAGACLAVGLKYAGSANVDAFTCLVRHLLHYFNVMFSYALHDVRRVVIYFLQLVAPLVVLLRLFFQFYNEEIWLDKWHL